MINYEMFDYYAKPYSLFWIIIQYPLNFETSYNIIISLVPIVRLYISGKLQTLIDFYHMRMIISK